MSGDLDLTAAAAELVASYTDRTGLLAVVGPTGTGKTALACELAHELDGEIVSVDSVQIYRGVDLGSGKPSVGELARAPHHLVSCVDLDAPMDAGLFVAMADEAIAQVRARGRVPILCGGTFLWMKALVDGLAEMPAANEELRAEYARVAELEGRAALHARLAAVDPISATKLAPNDFVRVSRALEVYAVTGMTLSAFHEQHGFRDKRHSVHYAGIVINEPRYTEAVTARVRSWLSAGWVDEVQTLRDAGFGASRALQSVGFAQVSAFLDGALSRDELEGAIVRATRVFARRQRTWLNSATVRWFGTRSTPKRSKPGA